MERYERLKKILIKSATRLARSISHIDVYLINELEILDRQKEEITKEGNMVFEEFKKAAEAVEKAHETQEVSRTTFEKSQKEIDILKRIEQRNRSMMDFNTDLIHIVGTQENYLRQCIEHSSKIRSYFDAFRKNFQRTDSKALRYLYTLTDYMGQVSSNMKNLMDAVKRLREKKADKISRFKELEEQNKKDIKDLERIAKGEVIELKHEKRKSNRDEKRLEEAA